MELDISRRRKYVARLAWKKQIHILVKLPISIKRTVRLKILMFQQLHPYVGVIAILFDIIPGSENYHSILLRSDLFFTTISGIIHHHCPVCGDLPISDLSKILSERRVKGYYESKIYRATTT